MTVDKLIEMFEQNPKTVLKHGNIWLPISEAILYRKLSDHARCSKDNSE